MRKGFTLIELVLVLGILSVLFAITTIRFFGVQGKNSVIEAADILVADLKSQQTKAMTGVVPSGGTVPDGYGIHFEGNTYILFTGETYVAGSPTNSIVPLPTGVTVTSSFAGNSLVFMRASGEVKDFVSGSNTIDITTAASTDTRRIDVNQLGVIVGGI